jgi:putative membrane protein insertion efficiency factor
MTAAVATGFVYLYRWTLAPVLATLGGVLPGTQCCKYEPSCSQYALEAFRRYGIARGLVLAAWRLGRCNPWSHGGVDRVDDQRLFGRRS